MDRKTLGGWMYYLRLAGLSVMRRSDPSVLTSGQSWIYHCLSFCQVGEGRIFFFFLYLSAACSSFPPSGLSTILTSWKLITKPFERTIDLTKNNNRRRNVTSEVAWFYFFSALIMCHMFFRQLTNCIRKAVETLGKVLLSHQVVCYRKKYNQFVLYIVITSLVVT